MQINTSTECHAYIEAVHSYNIDFINRAIYLVGEEGVGVEEEEPGVTYLMASRFVKNLQILSQHNPDPITIHMKTCGGFVVEGMAIYDAIRACPDRRTTLFIYPITAYRTFSGSRSSIIFQAGDCRIMMPNSYFMFHEGTIEISDTVKGVKSALAFDNKFHEPRTIEPYVIRMKQKGRFKGEKPYKIRKWLKAQMDRKQEVYLTPEETVELGLADKISDTFGF